MNPCVIICLSHIQIHCLFALDVQKFALDVQKCKKDKTLTQTLHDVMSLF